MFYIWSEWVPTEVGGRFEVGKHAHGKVMRERRRSQLLEPFD